MESFNEEGKVQSCHTEGMEMGSPVTDDADDAASQEATQDHFEQAVPHSAKTIQTKSRFNFMDLPTELQLKVRLFSFGSPPFFPSFNPKFISPASPLLLPITVDTQT